MGKSPHVALYLDRNVLAACLGIGVGAARHTIRCDGLWHYAFMLGAGQRFSGSDVAATLADISLGVFDNICTHACLLNLVSARLLSAVAREDVCMLPPAGLHIHNPSSQQFELIEPLSLPCTSLLVLWCGWSL